jgi:hypothetical protein
LVVEIIFLKQLQNVVAKHKDTAEPSETTEKPPVLSCNGFLPRDTSRQETIFQ